MTTTDDVRLIDPTPGAQRHRPRAARHPYDGSLPIGLMDGTLNKRSMWGQGMLDAAERVLRAHQPDAVFARHQINPLENPPPDMWADTVARGHAALVIVAGDCVTCTTRGVRDAIFSEAAGVPAAVVCTAAVCDVVTAVCRSYGMPDLPSRYVTESFFGCSRDEIAGITGPFVEDLPVDLLPPASVLR
jgi:hypothetical protein